MALPVKIESVRARGQQLFSPPRHPLFIMAISSTKQSAAANFDALFGVQQGERVVSGNFKMLAPDRIATRPQVRKTYPKDEIDELCNSIRELHKEGLGIEGTGILQALIVVPDGDGYRLAFGEKRLRCAMAEELKEVPCIVIAAMSEGIMRLLQLTENAVRSSPPILDEAEAIRETQQEQKLSLRDLARMLGKGKGYVEDRLNLLSYPNEVQNMVSARADSLRSARHIAAVEDEAKRLALVRAVIEDDLSEREVKRRISGETDSSNVSSTQNGNVNNGASSTRSQTLGNDEINQNDTPRDPLTQCLKPASSFAAEAASLLKTAHLTPDYRRELAGELDVLEKQIGKIRKIIS